MGKKGRVITSAIIGLVLSMFVGVPGLLLAALVFPEGIHSGHALLYLGLATIVNFSLFFAATYYLLKKFRNRTE
jgi:hypothetical protein